MQPLVTFKCVGSDCSFNSSVLLHKCATVLSVHMHNTCTCRGGSDNHFLAMPMVIDHSWKISLDVVSFHETVIGYSL